MVGDEHDQMGTVIDGRKNACNLCGYNQLKHMFTDNHRRDKGFFKNIFPSLINYNNLRLRTFKILLLQMMITIMVTHK